MSDPRELDTPCPIAFCITGLYAGGAERCLAELATRLDPERFAPTIYSLMQRPPDEEAELVRILEAANIETRFLGLTSSLQFLTAARTLVRCWKRQPPKLVQTFLFHANVVGACVARRTGLTPVVAGIRVADPRSRWRLLLENHLTRNVAKYVCVSESVASYSAQRGLPAEKLVVIPNGVDMSRFQDVRPADLATLGCAAHRRAVVYIGRLDQQKRVDRLIAAFAAVRQDVPDHDLIVVGDGPLRGELEKQVRQLSLDGRVYFTGRRCDIPEILAACDGLLLASAWEGMPNVILEAMAAGKPVVCSDVEGVAELLGAQAEEQIVTATADGDERMWSRRFGERLVRIVGNDSVTQALGDCNRERAEQFSLQRMVSAYHELYASLLEEHRVHD